MKKYINILQSEIDKAQKFLDKELANKSYLKVLEVGCGSCSRIHLTQPKDMVGIDVSEKQLQRNNTLTEKIKGDIQTYKLPKSTFDLIVCWWVLEHLPQPKKALLNCQKALKEDGIIIIASPNIFSLKGIITKYTPHWFHVWAYRVIFGQKLAGIEDRAPFRTFLRSSISPASIKKFAQENELSIEYFSTYESPKQTRLRKKYFLMGFLWQSIKLVTHILSFGMVEVENTEYIIILKKPIKESKLMSQEALESVAI
ncbi:bifunctional 2-polyprenyl-6-hydroxyphenol methylase/3-demethylubiquinol 3-O-methyltransferase UbiG [Chroococcidiopsis sp. TS-821]|uniref:class I SAM-dependent methyltransferase n=1 Tax=Chroococcidiopsis sp. TS-821 TaxID=1378066 RepID=UPI000CEEA9BD|nr:class I SAM-dependent methyltransferase [Chroococcidiopsis sp. TS-821]PPS45535.1 methyltransferase type 12 [Chroococcidiopsis sp. TS-821]